MQLWASLKRQSWPASKVLEIKGYTTTPSFLFILNPEKQTKGPISDRTLEAEVGGSL